MNEEYVTSGDGWRWRLVPNIEAVKEQCCVYFLFCVPADKGYIGSTKHLPTRLKKHFGDLAKREHYNSVMQEAFNQFGLKSFTWGVVEECEIYQLAEREQHWIDYYLTTAPNRLFNIGEKAGRASRDSDLLVLLGDQEKALQFAIDWFSKTDSYWASQAAKDTLEYLHWFYKNPDLEYDLLVYDNVRYGLKYAWEKYHEESKSRVINDE